MSHHAATGPAAAGGPGGRRETGLRGTLGTGQVALMVVAAAAPLAVVSAPAPLAVALGNGPGAAGTFLLVAAAMLLFTVSMSALAPYVRSSGAFYAYVGHGLGPVPGLAAAGVSWLTYTVIQWCVCAYLGVQCDAVVRLLGGPDGPWWLYTLLGVAVIAVLGHLRIDLSARVLGAALALEVGGVLAVDLGVLVQGGAEGIHATGFTPGAVFPGGSAFAVSAMLCATAFLGFETTAVFRDEARDPDRTVPRATYLAICFIGLFYALSTWLVCLAWPGGELARVSVQGAPFLLGAARGFVGGTLSDILQVLLTTSLFACALSLHNVLARYDHVLARSGVLPAALGRVHRRHASPYVASAFTALVTLAAFGVMVPLGLDPVTGIVAPGNGLAALGFLVLLCLTCLSALVFFARAGTGGRPWRTRVWPAFGFLALAALAAVTYRHFPALVGKDPAVAHALAAAFPLAALAGAARAGWLRRRRPERYARVLALTGGAATGHGPTAGPGPPGGR
ncbi:APC family permease [Streptomyces sp. B1866]|uniref:APC family permease n=1 Tax=Streptomyces sp. B1866 TaxID=3075431 RepID=UPI002890B298|nr:APC family permease [Streptomyces sp. B1866]MDT3395068.1 APC family permease [Streptomyces sp. B1866]